MRPNWRNGKKNKDSSSGSQEGSSQDNSVALTTTSKQQLSNSTSGGGGGGVADSQVPQLPNPKDSTSTLFFDISLEFATALNEVWPKDEVIQSKLVELQKHTDNKSEYGSKLAQDFHSKYQDKYSLVLKKDPSFFSDKSSSDMKLLKAQDKYLSSSNEIRETVWEYLKNLVQYGGMVDMYSKCPQGMLDSISGIAGGLITKMQSGEMDLSNINPLQLGQMMMRDMKTEDLEQFGNAIMQSGNIENMMSLMQSTMGGMGGMPDMSSLASMASMMQPK